MANPNILAATSIYGNTTYLIPSNTSVTTWTALTPSSGTVNKVENITVSNVTSSAATVTISINSATSGSGTAYRIAYQISVPANATLVVVDKTTSFYVGESQSVVVTVGTGSALELVASYEAIT
jgi:hypothetical protein